MKAIQMSAFGGPEVLEYVDIQSPEPNSGEVRVRLYAAGVNPADTYIRTGTYVFFKPEMPYVPGMDGAGIVESVGEGVTRLKPGDRVFVAALLAKRNTGTYAEEVVCDAEAVYLLPDSFSFGEGAALGVPTQTAYRALFQSGRLKPGETVLIHGASGGVGSIAVQLARSVGANVIGTAGTEAGMEFVRKMGAHNTLNHSTPDYLDKVYDITNGHGADVIIEMLANVNLEKDFTAIAKYGRIVIVGSRGSIEFTPRLAMVKEASVIGMALWNATPDEYRTSVRAIAASLENGVIRPVVGREIPLEQAAQAHIEILEKSGSAGKMVLTM